MSERDELALPAGGGAEVDREADAVARLVRLAGARPAVPSDRALRVESAVREAWLESMALRRRNRRMVWGAAAALAATLAVALGVAWWPRPAPPAPLLLAEVERVTGGVELLADSAAGAAQLLVAGTRLAEGAEVSTGPDGRAALRLLGGPSLRLDLDSRLRMTGDGRVALLGGAVYVDSQGGAPVIVETPWGVVEERGTQFEVRLAADAVRVRVREGAVSLADEGSQWEAPAGAELTLTADGRLARASVPFHGDAWSWVQQIAPPFQLDGRTLGEFLAWVGRETGWQVSWRDTARAALASSTVLHGSVDGLPPEQALAAVLPTCGLAHRLEGGTVLLFDHVTAPSTARSETTATP
jgi:ferric-dicitrate binding protein FerR (iron transport regulator)